MEFDTVIKKRKSTRLFSDKKLEKEKLDKILEAGRIAPTAKNSQAFKVFVIESEEGLKKLDKLTKCRYNAQTVLFICGVKDKAYTRGNHSFMDIDTSIVTTHMMLAATNLGVDNIWIGLFDPNEVKEAFSMDDNLVPINMLSLGYKSKLCPPSPFHKIRRKISELVEYK